MTREEAVRIIDELIALNKFNMHKEGAMRCNPRSTRSAYLAIVGVERIEALEMARQALESSAVRCEECKFWDGEHVSCEGLAKCVTGESGLRYRSKNDFCSRGQRKENKI